MKKIILSLLSVLLLCGCAAAPKEKLYPDVKVSRLIRVIDGDTFVCDIDEHSAIAGKSIGIRIRNLNTPELRSRNPDERKSALEEKERLKKLLTQARTIHLKNLGRDKYFRIDADVYVDNEPLLPKLNQKYRLKEKSALSGQMTINRQTNLKNIQNCITLNKTYNERCFYQTYLKKLYHTDENSVSGSSIEKSPKSFEIEKSRKLKDDHILMAVSSCVLGSVFGDTVYGA